MSYATLGKRKFFRYDFTGTADAVVGGRILKEMNADDYED